MTLLSMILLAVVAIDNVLAQIPSIQSNSTFQLISGWISQAASVFAPKPPTPPSVPPAA